MTRTTWTNRMQERLAGMKRAGMTNKAIAIKLNVTENAVKHKAKHLKANQVVKHKPGIINQPIGVMFSR
jgi:DNA-binding CsgD family transcriptional regulator